MYKGWFEEKWLRKLFRELPERQQFVFSQTILSDKPKSYGDIAKIFKVSRQRVFAMRKQAVYNLSKLIKEYTNEHPEVREPFINKIRNLQ